MSASNLTRENISPYLIFFGDNLFTWTFDPALAEKHAEDCRNWCQRNGQPGPVEIVRYVPEEVRVYARRSWWLTLLKWLRR